MAVPKKRTSKAKKNQRKATWKKKVLKQTEKYSSLLLLRTLKIQSGLIELNMEKITKKMEKRNKKKLEIQREKEKKKQQQEEMMRKFNQKKGKPFTKVLNKGVIQLPDTKSDTKSDNK
jgi:hypothetical protein